MMQPEALAATHGAAFGDAGWSASDFAAYLDAPTTLITGTQTCFAVFRVIGPEAEILTLATHPDAQGQGCATAMLKSAMQELAQRGVSEIFLDVADTNTAALALYQRAGFVAFSQRAQYYATGASAICMKAELSVTFY